MDADHILFFNINKFCGHLVDTYVKDEVKKEKFFQELTEKAPLVPVDDEDFSDLETSDLELQADFDAADDDSDDPGVPEHLRVFFNDN